MASEGFGRASRRARVTLALLLAASVGGLATPVAAQQAVPRILEQDPTLDNLVDPPGYVTAPLGSLGAVDSSGHGPGSMVLVAGFGFGGGVFAPLTAAWHDRYTLYAVTLPGFGGTPAPPAPPATTSFGEQTWLRAAAVAVTEEIERRGLDDVVLVGHWLGGTQVVLDVARALPGRVRAVVLLAGSARWVTPEPSAEVPDDRPLQERVAAIDRNLAPRWFQTVTRETWDDNNFLPGDYAEHPVLGLRLWRQAARPPLHVWVRYLCEFLAQDSTLGLDEVAAPILLLLPGLEGAYHPPGNDYMRAYTSRSWATALEAGDGILARTIPHTRVVMWAEHPERIVSEVDEFLASH